MQKDPAAEKWFQGKPAEPALRRVREAILRADPLMRFADVKEADARAAELGRIVVAWCDVMSTPKAKKTRAAR